MFRINLITLFVAFLLIFSSCSSNLAVRGDIHLEQLKVCIEFEDTIPPEFQKKLDSRLYEFISDYNNKNNNLKLAPCDDSTKSSLKIYVNNTSFVSPGQQVAAIGITTLGIIVPVVMINSGSAFYIWFAYFPQNRSAVDFILTEDIAEQNRNIRTIVIKSSPYFGDIEKQENRQIESFF